jgi:hypothetical protein
MQSGNFQMFDQGSPAANQAKYGQATPPIIPIDSITKVPVAMFVGDEDSFADPTDAHWAYTQIPSAIFYQELKNFDHSSFTDGKDMSYTQTMVDLVHKYNPLSSGSLLQNLGLW